MTLKNFPRPTGEIGGPDLPMNDMPTGSSNNLTDDAEFSGAYGKGYTDMGSIAGSTKSDPMDIVPGKVNQGARIK